MYVGGHKLVITYIETFLRVPMRHSIPRFLYYLARHKKFIKVLLKSQGLLTFKKLHGVKANDRPQIMIVPHLTLPFNVF